MIIPLYYPFRKDKSFQFNSIQFNSIQFNLSAGSATASQCDGPQFASDRIPASVLQREDPGAPKNAARGQNFFGVEK